MPIQLNSGIRNWTLNQGCGVGFEGVKRFSGSLKSKFWHVKKSRVKSWAKIMSRSRSHMDITLTLHPCS